LNKLILQGLGTGGNNYLATGKQRRHQIGKGLAGAGPGLGDEYRLTVDGRCNLLGHVDLLLTHAIAPNGLSQRTAGGKNFLIGGQREGTLGIGRKACARTETPARILADAPGKSNPPKGVGKSKYCTFKQCSINLRPNANYC
jgi:hypothetical protein